jgi:XTP/dITP diphosphohydrolase
MTRRLLIATTNPAKLAEYRLLMRGLDLELVSLRDLAISEAPEETGATFAENAQIKARYYFARAGIPTLADDGGLEVDALGGEPGVRSHRWLGTAHDDSDAALVAEVMRRMEGVAPARRGARIRAAIVLIYEEAGEVRERIAEGAIEGVIGERAYGEIRAGFPYRAVLYLPERNCFLGELGDEEEAQVSQRRIALAALRSDLERIARQPVANDPRA